jgi:hypothetical protein
MRLKCSYGPEAWIVNISANGCKVESRSTPGIGEHVEFTANLRDQPTTLRGVVVHVREGLEFGMRFVGLDEDAVARVRAAAAT